MKLSLELQELLLMHGAFREVDKRLIAVERALEALLRRENEAEQASSSSDGWY